VTYWELLNIQSATPQAKHLGEKENATSRK
jgi:hypothetical protein